MNTDPRLAEIDTRLTEVEIGMMILQQRMDGLADAATEELVGVFAAQAALGLSPEPADNL